MMSVSLFHTYPAMLSALHISTCSRFPLRKDRCSTIKSWPLISFLLEDVTIRFLVGPPEDIDAHGRLARVIQVVLLSTFTFHSIIL